MARHGYADKREVLAKRVNRLEGHVRSVGRMIQEDRYCIDIVNQLSAIQATARQISLQLIKSHVS